MHTQALSHAGYIGVIDRSADRGVERRSLLEAGLSPDRAGFIFALPDVAMYRFPNDYGAGVLLGTADHPACSVATRDAPHEMAAYHHARRCYASPVTDSVICPLDADGVRRILDEIAALPALDVCSHARPDK